MPAIKRVPRVLVFSFYMYLGLVKTWIITVWWLFSHRTMSYLFDHQVVDSIDDSTAQSRRGIHVVHIGQWIWDDAKLVSERKLHLLFYRAAVLQQSQTGSPVVCGGVGQGKTACHVLDELFGPAVVLQAHPLRTIQQENDVHWPLDTTSYCRLWNRYTNG